MHGKVISYTYFQKACLCPQAKTPCALPPVPVNLGCGKADGQRQMTLLKPWQIKKICIHRKDALGDKLLPRSKNWWLEFLAPKDANNCFFKVEVFLLAPKTGTGSKCFGVNLERRLKITFSQRRMDILEYKCRFRIDLGLRCSTKSRYNSILFPTLKSQ